MRNIAVAPSGSCRTMGAIIDSANAANTAATNAVAHFMAHKMQTGKTFWCFAAEMLQKRPMQFEIFSDASTVMELHYVLVQDAAGRRHVLCERVAVAAGGLWVYRYIPRYGIYIDEGFMKDVEELKRVIAQKYNEVFLVKGFEEAASFFARPYPKIIQLAPEETFCTRISGEVFDCDLRGEEIEYLGKWISGVEKPKSLSEALEKLNEYAERLGAWVILKRYPRYASAHLAYPSP